MTRGDADHPAPRPLAERVGIFQGRLVPSTTGALQSSPGDRWPEELTSAGALGLSHVELLAERTEDPANPVWHADGRAALRRVAADAGVALVSLCIEEPLDAALDEATAIGLADRLTPVVAGLGLRVVVLPMDAASDLAALPWEPVAGAVGAIAARLADHGARVVVELTLRAERSVAFLKLVEPSVGVCYDVGNATAAGYVPGEEIRVLGDRIWHVHAKDKDHRGDNVRFGTGNVDFAAAFAALRAVGYDGPVTIEATRGDDPVATAAEHRAFLLALDPPR